MLTFKFCVFWAPEASFPFAIDLPRIVSCLAKILSIVKITKKIVKIRGKMFAKKRKTLKFRKYYYNENVRIVVFIEFNQKWWLQFARRDVLCGFQLRQHLQSFGKFFLNSIIFWPVFPSFFRKTPQNQQNYSNGFFSIAKNRNNLFQKQFNKNKFGQ